jgi:hypothetical protein
MRQSRHCQEGTTELVIARRVLPTKQSSISLLIFRTGLLRREYPSRNDETGGFLAMTMTQRYSACP